ncbi:putative S-acyltransferase [Cocos nucifera]|uniref:Putative S-acyltransferase n=1 Tax=Cocos nucifera TaxID=13894 RepID=A0A8K0HZ31_COCNU|nr:putative S-acyltransferase [Cocos nucifera]
MYERVSHETSTFGHFRGIEDESHGDMHIKAEADLEIGGDLMRISQDGSYE